MPGAPTQTWNCSVSFRWKRMPGAGSRTSGDRTRVRLAPAARPAGAPPARAGRAAGRARGCPAAARTTLPGDVRAPVVGRDRPAGDRRDHLGAADHRPAERVLREHRLGEQVVDEVLRRVLDHRDLLEHDLALGVEVGERRREDHVRHHVERVLEVPVGHARVDDRVLARGGRVQLAAHLVEDLRDLLRVVRPRALEEQVLDEVRDARLRLGLVARAGADPEAERHRPDARHALGDQALAGVELREDVFLH